MSGELRFDLLLAGPRRSSGDPSTAIYARFYHASISAKRATVDFIVSQEANDSLTKARRVFARSGRKGPQHLEKLLDCVSEGDAGDAQWDELADINMYLNHCELVAVAITSDALDEEMYKRAHRTLYVQAWYRYEWFIRYACTKKSQSSMFEHFEDLARKWSN